jgi:hypothetical protein
MDPVTEDLPSQLDAADALAIVEEVITKVPAIVDTLTLAVVEEADDALKTVEVVFDKLKEAEVAHLPATCGFMEPLRMFLQSLRRLLSKPKGPLTTV